MKPLQSSELSLSISSRTRLDWAYHHVAERAKISPVTAVMLAHKAINVELIVS